MTVQELVSKLGKFPLESDVSIAIDDLTDRVEIAQVVGVTCDELTEVLICENTLVR